MLDLCLKLGPKGKLNKELALEILEVFPAYIEKVVNTYSTEKDFDFAFDIV